MSKTKTILPKSSISKRAIKASIITKLTEYTHSFALHDHKKVNKLVKAVAKNLAKAISKAIVNVEQVVSAKAISNLTSRTAKKTITIKKPVVAVKAVNKTVSKSIASKSIVPLKTTIINRVRKPSTAKSETIINR